MKEVIVGGTTPAVPLTQAQIDAQAATYAYQAAATTVTNSPTPANIASVKNAFQAQTTANAVPGSSTIPDYAAVAATVPQTIADTQAAVADANTATTAVVGATNSLADLTAQIAPPPKAPAGPTGPTLAKDTFRNTLALFFGADEVAKPWVDGLYGYVSNFYNTGSTIDESLNLALQSARNDPAMKPFTDRFKGVFALQDKLAKGEAVTVPTIAEYFHSESVMGDVLRQAGMGELANQNFLGDILGQGKSVLEVSNLIDQTFASIDNAPTALKGDLETILNLGVSRTDIAKALLTGKDGAQALNKKITEISSFSAAKSQGVNIDMGTAADVAARGYDYNQSLSGFADVKRLERAQSLGKMSGIDFTQNDAIAAQFQNSVNAQDKIAKISQGESSRFAGRSGRLNSQDRAQGQV
jgi:hypothetical protein